MSSFQPMRVAIVSISSACVTTVSIRPYDSHIGHSSMFTCPHVYMFTHILTHNTQRQAQCILPLAWSVGQRDGATFTTAVRLYVADGGTVEVDAATLPAPYAPGRHDLLHRLLAAHTEGPQHQLHQLHPAT